MRTPELERSLTWLKQVAGIDDAYIARWSDAEWLEWQRAMRAPRSEFCPSVPAWMQPLMPEWHWDFSLPYPTVAQLWPTPVDWFAQAREHDDFVLRVDEPADGWVLSLDQLSQVWRLAQEHNLRPWLSMTVVPEFDADRQALIGVAGQIEAFYLDRPSDPHHEGLSKVEDLLARPGEAPIGPLRGEPVIAWEWMYG